MDMTFYLTDKNRISKGALGYSDKMDLDLGDTNDFEMTINRSSDSLQHIVSGGYFFVPGTEYGGKIEGCVSATNEPELLYRGLTWRGFLDKAVIEPPSGQAYRYYSGEANAVLGQIVSGVLGGMFEVSADNSGININRYAVRYLTVLDAINKILKTAKARLKIEAVPGNTADAPFRVVLSAVKIQNLSETVTYDEDNKINVSIESMGYGVNHLICLGSGEGTARDVLHLYMGPDGLVRKTRYYTGLSERVAVYDYTSAQDMEDLEEYGSDKLIELSNYKKMVVSVADMDVDIGDVIGGKDAATGNKLQKPIVRKILNLNKDDVSIEYRTEGEE